MSSVQDSWEVRPRFRREIDTPPDEVREILLQVLLEPDCPIKGRFHPHQIELYIPEADSHTWSPHLSLAMRLGPNATILEGRYGPAPAVWTFFLGLYAISTVGSFVGGILGISQMQLGMPPWGFWVALAALTLLTVSYIASRLGRRMSYEQMEVLHTFLQRSLQHSPQTEKPRRNDEVLESMA